MQFEVNLHCAQSKSYIPVNYQYPLSSALYRIIAKGDSAYAEFLHNSGYGKGFKFFTFSQINCPFQIEDDRFHLQEPDLSFVVSFHLPQAMTNFIKGIFQSEQIEIADDRSRASFSVRSIESLPDPLKRYPDTEIVQVSMKPLSPIVVGVHNQRGKYDFLSPEDPRFPESLLYNWRSKIATCFDESTAQSAVLLLEVLPAKYPFRSRLVTIKAGTLEETRVRGWLNFELKVIAEKRFVELLINAGAGLYNAMGFGSLQVLNR